MNIKLTKGADVLNKSENANHCLLIEHKIKGLFPKIEEYTKELEFGLSGNDRKPFLITELPSSISGEINNSL